MYTRYFGLNEKPFAIAPNPRYLYMSELHREALAHLVYGITSDGCIILFTGEVGTGKTTVCRCLLEQLPSSTDIALVLNPKLSITELLATIHKELKIADASPPATVKDYIDSLNRHLLNAHSRGRRTAIVIDEAQNLDLDILEHLRLLTNLETDTHKLLQIVLIGQPELRDILQDPRLAQINQRITTRYHLLPLHKADISTYIKHRLTTAGSTNSDDLFAPGALRKLTKLSGGIPRLINLLCDHALLGAYVENEAQVTRTIMTKAGKELFPRKRTAFLRRRTLALGVLFCATLLCSAVPLSLYYMNQRSFPEITLQLPGFLQSKRPEVETAQVEESERPRDSLQASTSNHFSTTEQPAPLTLQSQEPLTELMEDKSPSSSEN